MFSSSPLMKGRKTDVINSIPIDRGNRTIARNGLVFCQHRYTDISSTEIDHSK